jgi:DNA repair exonuclease SbcCD nuclease subunit
MRIIHTADWQLGKSFARFTPEVRAALTDARFDAVDTIGRLAREKAVSHVVVAGDVFDTTGPSDREIVQAVTRMSRAECTWWLMPGNHDHIRSGGLWDRVRAKLAPNIRILDRPEPVEISSGAWLLPAPLEFRHTQEDPTDAMTAMATPPGAVRIGLAHGSIVDFAKRGEAKNLLPPNRAELSGLDYLALGDWHGFQMIGGRTCYSGTPETDRFDREVGSVALVELNAGALPSVERIETGRFHWMQRQWRISDAADFAAERARLEGEVDPVRTLLRLELSGAIGIADRAAVIAEAEGDLSDALRWCEIDDRELHGRPTDDDLAAMNVEGTLGAAARLLQMDCDAGGPETAVAAKALERLYVETIRAGDLS